MMALFLFLPNCVHIVCCVRVTDLRWLLYCGVCHGGCVSCGWWFPLLRLCCLTFFLLFFLAFFLFCPPLHLCCLFVLPPPVAHIVVRCGVCVHVVPCVLVVFGLLCILLHLVHSMLPMSAVMGKTCVIHPLHQLFLLEKWGSGAGGQFHVYGG
jgi:hypothetical protein